MLSYDCRDGMSSTIYTLDTEKSAPPDQPVALARYVLLCYFNRAVVVSEDCSGVVGSTHCVEHVVVMETGL